jgi:hypothetical protein
MPLNPALGIPRRFPVAYQAKTTGTVFSHGHSAKLPDCETGIIGVNAWNNK